MYLNNYKLDKKLDKPVPSLLLRRSFFSFSSNFPNAVNFFFFETDTVVGACCFGNESLGNALDCGRDFKTC